MTNICFYAISKICFLILSKQETKAHWNLNLDGWPHVTNHQLPIKIDSNAMFKKADDAQQKEKVDDE